MDDCATSVQIEIQLKTEVQQRKLSYSNSSRYLGILFSLIKTH